MSRAALSSSDLLTVPRAVARDPLDSRPRRGASRTLCEAAAALGLTLDDLARLSERSAEPSLALELPESAIGVVIGPSGAGKSTLLWDIEIAATRAGWRVSRAPEALPERPCIELFGCGAPGAMRALSRAGLADARVFVRPPSSLSAGERARLGLALALHEAGPGDDQRPVLLLLDEFGASLDGTAARSVASLLRRAVDRTRGLRIVLATHRHALLPLLAPRWTVTLDERAHATLRRAGASPPPDPLAHVEIALGSSQDLLRLAHHHYRAGRPRAVVRVLVAREQGNPQPIGVLAVAMPTLNGAWRRRAWPDLFEGAPSGREHARRLNEHVRTISRVIIAPRLRGLGLARRLVEAYLADPLTERTEALAAMGRACPFFARAGMTAHHLAPSRRDARLLDALHHAGLADRSQWHLARPEPLWRCLSTRDASPWREPFVRRELALWADGARSTRSAGLAARTNCGPGPPGVFERACRDLASRAIAYTHGP